MQFIPCRLCRSFRYADLGFARNLQIIHAPVNALPMPLKVHCLHLLIPGARIVSGTSQPEKTSSSGSPNKSADTPFAPVNAPQGLQEVHGPHLLVPGAKVGGWHMPTNKKSSPGSPNKSADTSFSPISASQGLQEAHGLHLLVPGAGVGGDTSP